jgi:hypothetical protein
VIGICAVNHPPESGLKAVNPIAWSLHEGEPVDQFARSGPSK